MKSIPDDYRQLLRRTLEQRCIVNPRYSLRAFSRDLGLSPASLSLILRNKKGLSRLKAQLISEKLGLTADQRVHFVQQVEASDSRSKSSRIQARKEIEARQKNEPDDRFRLQVDTFAAISDWHHFAILELTKLKVFKAKPKWIADRLAISEIAASEALERLLRLGLLKKQKNSLKLLNSSTLVASEVPSEAIQNFNRQMLNKATEAISFQTLAERELSTLTFAINKKAIPRLKEKIREFNREFSHEIDETGDPKTSDEVYCFAMQLFRLTEKETK